MVEETQKYKKHALFTALVFTALVFSAGILVGKAMDSYKSTELLNTIRESELDTESYLVEQKLLAGDEDTCDILSARIEALDAALAKTRSQLSKWDTKSRFQKDFDYLKRKHFILEVRFLGLIEDMNKKCGANYDTVVFFYSLDHNPSLRQGIILDAIDEKTDNLIVISLDKEYDKEPLVKLLKTKYGVTVAPTIVLNSKTKIEGFTSQEEIENLIAPQTQAYISITFDDGLESQYGAAEKLEEYGWRGTFYIPAGLVGKEFENIPVMSENQILDLQKRGHEIGGHTYNHVAARLVSAKAYEEEVLNGAVVAGIATKNFAYPYGDSSYKDVVAETYNSARTVIGGVNKIPVADKHELKALTLVHQNEQYKSVSGYLAATKRQGGWLIVLIHGVNDDPRLNIDISQDEFRFVLQQIKQSGIAVLTVEEVLNATA